MWSTHLGRETRKRWQGGGHCPLSYTANPLIYALSLRYTNTNTHKNTIHAHTRNMYIHNGHCLVSQTVNQLIYTLLYNIDNTNTDTEKYSHTKYKYTCSDMQNSLFHCQARFKLDPKVQREAQELHFSRPYPYTPCSRILWYAECAILIVHDTAIENTEW